ncbi:PI-PLC X domain-containing protein At5g67130 [Setaria viridis]|nr:PI-PLC X domain-containing protein At5g67130-like [Setaria viridis]
MILPVRPGKGMLALATRTDLPSIMPTSRRLLQQRLAAAIIVASVTVASGAALVGDLCSAAAASCGAGLRCTTCVPPPGTGPAACARTTPLDPKMHGAALPFNRYSWLTTHNSFAIVGTKSPLGSAIISPPNQEDSVSSQLRNGVRGLMLDAYDFNNDVWLCHSFAGKCLAFTAYVPALTVLKDIEAFLASNPSEVVTVFIEDYTAPGSLSNVFNAAGLTKYWFPVDRMPAPGKDWPLLKDMIADNHRLIVFTSKQGKQGTEGLAYQWDYVVENQYGSQGLVDGRCPSRAESKPMDSTAQSLILMNFFTTNPSQSWACGNNSAPLVSRLRTCYDASAKRWPNFIAVDFYMRSGGGGAPLATDVANGRLQCGCDTIAHCTTTKSGTCAMPSSSAPAASPRAAGAAAPSPGPGPAAAASPSPSMSSSPRAAPAPAAAPVLVGAAPS